MYILRKFVGSPILRGLANHNGKSYFAVFSTKALTSDEKRSALSKLNENSNGISKWKPTDDGRDAIQKLFEFADFSQAWGFMSKCSLIAEKVGRLKEYFSDTIFLLNIGFIYI